MAGERLQKQYGQSELGCIPCIALRFFEIYDFEVAEGKGKENAEQRGSWE